MDMRKPVPKGVYILPNLFTAASLLAAFYGLVLAQQENIEGCAFAILLSAVMDGLDGKVARLTNTASEFGIQFDSLADLAAFGITPAFMVWMWVLNVYGAFGIAVCFLFAACTAMRLARFNVSAATGSRKFFVGLPSPAGGCSLAFMVLFSAYFPDWMFRFLPFIMLVVTTGVALLMVSRVRYFAFKEYGFVQTHPFRSLVMALLIFVLIFSAPRLMGGLVFVTYLLSGLIYTFILLPRHNRTVLNKLTKGWPDASE